MGEQLRHALVRLRQRLAHPWALLHYLVLRTETHAYCAAIAFFALVAFYPLCTLMLWASKGFLAETPAHSVMVQTLQEYYPQGQEFLLRNLESAVYRFSVNATPVMYTKSIQFGTVDITDSPLDLTAGVPPRTEISVVLGSDVG